ncbi:putative S-adenosyl-L-methionine-dependent protein-lysine N- methyltransferase [Lyophyllum shimeji]|uniref:Protein-lysine N-methyltransferase EFM6 n=1 Tax=Lyophyllum shimeji TaxID=47721 RepID=A0A9P3PDK2_LYOSH|nr:putative S-adenosyl-L-methionine-dependent protein-lysine N- methyltransferase [Lyophyllum shimeji]
MAFHDDLALDEQLDALDPLRHLMHQPESDDTERDLDAPSSSVLSVLPKQSRSIQNETLHLSFAHPHAHDPNEPPPIAIKLAVDASPGCGGIAWPAGEILSSYLVKRGPTYVQGRTIIELGSGTGLVGLVAGTLAGRAKDERAKVWITDQAPLLDIMRQNVRANALEANVAVAELNWGSLIPPEIPAPDLILAADCVYFEPAFPLLVQTLRDLVDRNAESETEVLFCYKKRRKADKRFFGMLKKSFSWTEVMDDPDRETSNREAITLLRLIRRRPLAGSRRDDHEEEARRRI